MITRCSNGHWYDTSTNKTCPHCKQESEKLSIRLNDMEEDDRTISITEVDLSLGEELGAIIGSSIGSSAGSPIGSFTPPPADAIGEDEDGDKTVSFGFFGITATQPVTGWLVCMNGEEKGKDFRLHSGKNFIGRGASMDVMLVDDKTIAREKHCSIAYDPKGNSFYVSAENGNITYLNKEIIEEAVKIKDGDEITVGETTLQFIPFCREGRTWEKE